MTCGLPWLRAKHDFLAQGATNLNDMKLAPCQLLDRGAWQSKVQTPREPWPIGGIITEFSTSCADQAAIIGEGCSEMGHMIEAARECPMRGTCWGGGGGVNFAAEEASTHLGCWQGRRCSGEGGSATGGSWAASTGTGGRSPVPPYHPPCHTSVARASSPHCCSPHLHNPPPLLAFCLQRGLGASKSCKSILSDLPVHLDWQAS